VGEKETRKYKQFASKNENSEASWGKQKGPGFCGGVGKMGRKEPKRTEVGKVLPGGKWVSRSMTRQYYHSTCYCLMKGTGQDD